MATLVLNIRRAVTGLALICLQNALAHAESIAPNSDTRERWRVDYADIGYPNVGFSPYIKGWINGYLTPADYPNGAAILPPPPVEDSAASKADVEILPASQTARYAPGPGGGGGCQSVLRCHRSGFLRRVGYGDFAQAHAAYPSFAEPAAHGRRLCFQRCEKGLRPHSPLLRATGGQLYP